MSSFIQFCTFRRGNFQEADGELAARHKRNPWNSSRDGSQETFGCGIDHRVCRFLLGAGQFRKCHVGFQDYILQRYPLEVMLVEARSKNFFRYSEALLQSLVSIHQHFRLDDGD